VLENRPRMPTVRNKSWLSAFECFRYVLSNRVTAWRPLWAVRGADGGADRCRAHALPAEEVEGRRPARHNTPFHQPKAKMGSLCVDNTTRTKTPVLRLRSSFVSCSRGVATLERLARQFRKSQPAPLGARPLPPLVAPPHRPRTGVSSLRTTEGRIFNENGSVRGSPRPSLVNRGGAIGNGGWYLNSRSTHSRVNTREKDAREIFSMLQPVANRWRG